MKNLIFVADPRFFRMFSPSFYELNYAQHFPFPHTNCDEIDNEVLKRKFMDTDYICPHIIRHFMEKTAKGTEQGTGQGTEQGTVTFQDLYDRVKLHPVLQELGAGFMRLKFLAEVIDPNRLKPQLDKMVAILEKIKDPHHPLGKKELLPIFEWVEKGADRFSQIDIMANYTFALILVIIESIVQGKDHLPFDTHWIQLYERLSTFNQSMPTIRENPCGEYIWKQVTPYELPLLPYLMFVLRSWDIVKPLLDNSSFFENMLNR